MTTTPKLDTFTRAYIEAALWSSTLDPFGECPQCGKDERILCKWSETEYGLHVCSECSTKEPNYEPPADENYSASDLAEETLTRMVADCERFQTEQADLITDDNLTHGPVASREHEGMYDSTERAGHDFWLTRNGHGCGFFDGDWTEPAATQLTNAAHAFGSFDLYVGNDGKIYA